MKALVLLLLTFSSFSFAQGYRMTGNFTLFAETSAPIRSTYTITWVETNSFIEGRYSDNVLATSAGVTGIVAGGKRTFQISLPTPDPRHGVKSLTIETADFQGLTPNISTSVVAKGMTGAPITSTIVFAQIAEDNTATFQAQTDNCSLGFGALTGFCGIYSGNMAEESDPGNLCQLTGARLELARNGDLSLYFQYNGSLRDIPRHDFGSMLGTPIDQNINARVRHCGPLGATQMNSVACQTLHLVGAFQDFGGIKRFSGTYDIQDEVTGNTCKYSLTLALEAIY